MTLASIYIVRTYIDMVLKRTSEQRLNSDDMDNSNKKLYRNYIKKLYYGLTKTGYSSSSFPHIKTLKELHITDMRYLTRVEKGTFSALANLKELYLTDNKNLEWIDEDAFSLEDKYQNSTKTWIPLKTLHLQRNNLSSLSENMFNDWKSLETIDIQFNPWSCDCDNQWLISKLIPVIQNETNHSTKHLQCYYPKDLRGFNMSEMAMHNKVLRCTDKYGNLWPENDGSILLGILIGILTTVPIMFLILFFCQRKNYFGLIGTRGPGDYARTFYKPADSDDF